MATGRKVIKYIT